LAAARQAVSAGSYDAAEVATVFATSGSDGETLHRICEALASPERELSPTRFHNSVHNAAAGYWTIAAGSRRPSASVCGYDASFAAGLLEAVSQVYAEQTAVLLVAYDVPYPPPLQAVRPFTRPFAVALLLTPEPRPATLASCRVALNSRSPVSGQQPVVPPELASNPAAQSLVLLSMIACDRREPLQLGYLEGCQLVLEPIAWS
jgi:Beta-ketoacyl synthase, N-terminal domain